MGGFQFLFESVQNHHAKGAMSEFENRELNDCWTVGCRFEKNAFMDK